MQSQWHNCPTINGVQQKDGKRYKATDVSYSSTEDTIKFSADIAGGYPEEADVKTWFRTIEFNQKLSTIVVTDKYELKKWIQPLKVHFISHLKPEKITGQIKLNNNGSTLLMDYDSKLFNVEFDTKIIDKEDNILRGIWGDSVHRMTLVEKQHQSDAHPLKGEFVTLFSLPKGEAVLEEEEVEEGNDVLDEEYLEVEEYFDDE